MAHGMTEDCGTKSQLHLPRTSGFMCKFVIACDLSLDSILRISLLGVASHCHSLLPNQGESGWPDLRSRKIRSRSKEGGKSTTHGRASVVVVRRRQTRGSYQKVAPNKAGQPETRRGRRRKAGLVAVWPHHPTPPLLPPAFLLLSFPSCRGSSSSKQPFESLPDRAVD